MKYFLAIDIGASSGRHIVGWREDGEIKTKEVYRFPNGVLEQNGHLIWDVDALLAHAKAGIAAAKAEFSNIISLSIDTWGVDYVLLRGDEEVRPVYAYRDSRTEAVIPKAHKILPFSELYAQTGCQFQPFNSIYQLYADKLAGRLDGVTDFLMIPEYLLWKLCGVKAKEYTNATTTGMVSAETGEFDPEIISALGLPSIFPKLQKPGTVLGEYDGIKCVLCATHDTASAVDGGRPMSYTEAKEKYAALGVDTEAALTKLKTVPLSLHCWQGDDVRGFDTDPTKPLTGGIQTTGSYPGRARTPQELMADIEEVLKLCPGTKKLNLHASYAIFGDSEWVDRDQLEPKHFAPWVAFCKKHGLGADFNPTFFSHPKCDPLTLISPNEETRRFWVEHGKACVRISQYLAEELGGVVTMNIWTGDGFKDIPADRLGPRIRYKQSIDEILSEPFDFTKVKPCVESKVFGIGVESYTVGSAEFALSYAAMNPGKCIPLMDNGHYHPTEVVSDKIPALLTFFPEIALHITRPVRWDSDHVVLFDDETKELCKEIVRCGGLDGRVHMALDYFDASVNRIAAWVTGFRNVQKALLNALLTPDMTAEQNAGNFTDLLVRQEELKTMPFGEIWAEYCRRCGVPEDGAWLPMVRDYEKKVLETRV